MKAGLRVLMDAVRFRRLLAAVVFLSLASGTARGAIPPGSEDDVRRVLTLLAAAGEEYHEGVHDGRVVRPTEFEEAKSFVEDAQQRLNRLSHTDPGVDTTASLFAEIGGAIDAYASPEAVAEKLTALRGRIVELTGVGELVYPPAAPSAVRGKRLFDENCVACHGEHGDGKGPNAAGLNPPPANFTDPQFIHGETPYDFYHVISLGKRNTAMPAWDGVLSVQERWDLVSYLWTLAPGSAGIAEGQGVYLANCASCHGATGTGEAPFSNVLVKAAPDLTQPQALARRTDAELFARTTTGVAGTPMPSFTRTLADDDRWKAVAFMRVLSLGGPGTPDTAAGDGGTGSKRFAGLLRLLGRTYEHAQADGETAAPDEYVQATALAEQVSAAAEALAERLRSTDAKVSESIRAATTAIVAQVRNRAPAAAVVASIEALAVQVGSQIPETATSSAGGAPSSATDTALAESRRLLEASVAAYGRGDREAGSFAADAYLEFEPLEIRLGATDPGLKTRIEERFLQLRQLLRTPGKDAEIRALAAAVVADFAAVRAALQPHTSPYALFVESATIILREGLEIVLVIGALIAYVVKTQNAGMRRSIYAGTTLGIAASLATAFVMGELLRLHPSSSDLLEGITMLLAAVVLFWVSYWLISKAEADKWQRYIRGKVQSALSGKRSVALAGAAFLAVYREGFETVLFYQALYASAPHASVTITAGFAVGGVALMIVYLLFRRFQVQIPIRQFFFATGSLLYILATIFAGQGMHELQEGGVIGVTAVPGIPTIPLLGVFPSLQSLGVQAVFVALLLYATAVALRRSRHAAATERDGDAAAELRALRAAIEGLRGELEMLRRSAPALPAAALGTRVEGLLVRVEELAGRVGTQTAVDDPTHGGGRRHGH
jgi:high-affinity iron transporter